MKTCRHCRTDNDDGATVCTECGLDFSPSTAAILMSRLPSAVRALNTKWLWRGFVIIGLPMFLVALYFLSLGPILRLYGAKPWNVWSPVPPAIRAIYKPQDNFPILGSIARPLRRYNQWWMGVDADKEKLIKLINHIDRSITNGMTQSQVLALIGQPFMWGTNGDGSIGAYYKYADLETSYFGDVTNGFVITFSNSVVLLKSPITSDSR